MIAAVDRERLGRLAQINAELQRRRWNNPLRDMRYLPLQDRFLRCRAKRALLRAGNQSQGKTHIGATELIYRLLGEHPYKRVRPPPIKAWVICGGGEQAQVVQERVWDLVPKDMVAPGCEYDPRKGAFKGKYPKLILKNGSTAEFKTGGQDKLNLASGTVHVVWIDEPPDSLRVYSEVKKRLLRTNGDLFLTLTPINRPVGWLREEVTKGLIEDIHSPLTPQAMIPVGATEPIRLPDGTVCDEAWIESVRLDTPDHEEPVIVDGEWECRTLDRYFTVFRSEGADAHVHGRAPTGDVTIVVGIDHGSRPGKQIALFAAVDESGDLPSVYVFDEYVDETGEASPWDDAKGILAILKRHGLEWNEVRWAHGDRVHLPGRAEQKSNLDLAGYLAKELGIRLRQLRPQIRTVKTKEAGGKNADSIEPGLRWLHRAMVREGGFGVSPNCTRLIDALNKYDLRDNDHKDPIDALRYALHPYIFGLWLRGRGPAPKVYVG